MTKITEVNIKLIRPRDGLQAIASCVVDDKIYLGSIGIYTVLDENKKVIPGKYRLTYPNRKYNDSAIEIFLPVNQDFAKELEKAIIAEYENLISEV